MRKSVLSLGVIALFAATVAVAQSPAPAASKTAPDSEACVKRCKEMAASRQAAKAKREAAVKEVQAQVEAAKKASGEKKIAALEAAVEKLVALQAESGEKDQAMMAGMAGGSMDCAGMGHEAGSMAGHSHATEGGMGHGKGMSCCNHGEEAPAAAAPAAPPAARK